MRCPQSTWEYVNLSDEAPVVLLYVFVRIFCITTSNCTYVVVGVVLCLLEQKGFPLCAIKLRKLVHRQTSSLLENA